MLTSVYLEYTNMIQYTWNMLTSVYLEYTNMIQYTWNILTSVYSEYTEICATHIRTIGPVSTQ